MLVDEKVRKPVHKVNETHKLCAETSGLAFQPRNISENLPSHQHMFRAFATFCLNPPEVPAMNSKISFQRDGSVLNEDRQDVLATKESYDDYRVVRHTFKIINFCRHCDLVKRLCNSGISLSHVSHESIYLCTSHKTLSSVSSQKKGKYLLTLNVLQNGTESLIEIVVVFVGLLYCEHELSSSKICYNEIHRFKCKERDFNFYSHDLWRDSFLDALFFPLSMCGEIFMVSLFHFYCNC